MSDDLIDEFLELQKKADAYHKKAEWQEKLRTLQEMLEICKDPGFPQSEQRQQTVLRELGGIYRRFGQYEKSTETLQQALDVYEHGSPMDRANILGEMGVVYRHSNDFRKARDVFQQQYRLGRAAALLAEVEMCRAIGNEGMSAYNLSQQKDPHDKEELLDIALKQLEERVHRARTIHNRLLEEDPDSKYVALSKSWEVIGMDRLTLVLVAQGKTREAVKLAKESQLTQEEEFKRKLSKAERENTDGEPPKPEKFVDPTIKGYSKFFYGNALWHDGQHEEAVKQWNAEPGVCSSAHSLCKEPASEHVDYLQLMAEAGVNFDSYDEQGFSALDYAYLSDNEDAKRMVDIILEAYRKKLEKSFKLYYPPLNKAQIETNIAKAERLRKRQSELRREYRTMLQEHLRPLLRDGSSDSIASLRSVCANLISNSKVGNVFDRFDYVKYTTFKKYGKLPRFDAEMSQRFAEDQESANDDRDEDFIVFFSYRWIGRASIPEVAGPDSADKIQWRRMVDAMEAYLKKNKKIDPE